MNKFMNKVTVFTLALIMAATAAVFAQYSPEKDFYTIEEFGGEATINNYFGKDTVVKIPPVIKGLPVGIVRGFSANTTITSVIIPDNVHTIGIDAFQGCTALESVTIGKGVRAIQPRAFFGCSALKSITLPSVNTIHAQAFQACVNLSTVTIMVEGRIDANGHFKGTDLLPSNRRVAQAEGGWIGDYFLATAHDLVIFVPKNSVDAYKKDWLEYRDRIVAIGSPRPAPPKVAESVSTGPSVSSADERDGKLNPKLVGTWKRTDGVVTYTFTADGKGTYKGSKSTDPLTWITDGGKVTISVAGSAPWTNTANYIISSAKANDDRLSMTEYGKTQNYVRQ